MIILNPTEDYFHGLTEPGSYEWSYFDGLSADGELAFVAIWFRGCPMSPYYSAAADRALANRASAGHGGKAANPDDYCALALGVYSHGKRVYSALHEGPGMRFAANGADVRFGNSTVHASVTANGTRSYLITIESQLMLGRGGLRGDIEIVAPPVALGSLASEYEQTPGTHYWVPVAPEATFTARLDRWRGGRGINKLRFGGRAYHDRNLGTAPIHGLAGDWYWGRLHADGAAFVYFAVAGDSGAPDFARAFVFRNGQVVAAEQDVAFSAESWARHWATLPYPRVLRGGGRSGLQFSAQAGRVVESGPFYHRMIGEIAANVSGQTMRGPAIMEYLRPSRLGVAAFRPFVKFRVRRARRRASNRA